MATSLSCSELAIKVGLGIIILLVLEGPCVLAAGVAVVLRVWVTPQEAGSPGLIHMAEMYSEKEQRENERPKSTQGQAGSSHHNLCYVQLAKPSLT